MRLFGRKYKLILDGQLEISELDIAFKIQKSSTKEPNKAEIKIYNLADDTRGRIQKQRDFFGEHPVRLSLEAGYTDNLTLIFSGDIHTIYSQREEADIVTTFGSADGIAQIRTARVAFGVKPGTTVRDVLKQIAMKGGLSVGNLDKALSGNVTIKDLGSTFPEGTVVDGSAYDELTRIAEAAGYEVSIQNGVLQVKPKGKALDDKAIELSSESGLVESPSIETSQDPAKQATGDKFVHAKALLVPGIFPGRRIKLVSEGFNGEYEVMVVEYSGELAGQDWYADMKLRPISGKSFLGAVGAAIRSTVDGIKDALL